MMNERIKEEEIAGNNVKVLTGKWDLKNLKQRPTRSSITEEFAELIVTEYVLRFWSRSLRNHSHQAILRTNNVRTSVDTNGKLMLNI
jgi:hypothetical protein